MSTFRFRASGRDRRRPPVDGSRLCQRRPPGDHPLLALRSCESRQPDYLPRGRPCWGPPSVVDERLRDAIRDLRPPDDPGHPRSFPEEAAHRRLLGKFYHRPPGGESWADVILRLRSMLNTINLHYCDPRVLIVCHQVVVFCFRYILESSTRPDPRDGQAGRGAECEIAEYRFEPDPKGLCIPDSTFGIMARRSRRRARPRRLRRMP